MELLTWESLHGYIGQGVPALLSMGGAKQVHIGYEPNPIRLFLRLPLHGEMGVPLSPYQELSIEARKRGDETLLEVSTKSGHLFREFHRLSGLLTEEYERDGQTAVGALVAVLSRWGELITQRKLLSVEEQLGLVGELTVLQGLINLHGADVISSWTGRGDGPQERHDFRLGQIDLEVKATRNPRRQHVIHGIRQLEPSLNFTLLLISLRFESAGFQHGFSLIDHINGIREMISGNSHASQSFEEKLGASGFNDRDSVQYADRYLMADAPLVIRVDDFCPRIVSGGIKLALGAEMANRIGPDISYRIDVEGLGEPLGSSKYAGIVGCL